MPSITEMFRSLARPSGDQPTPIAAPGAINPSDPSKGNPTVPGDGTPRSDGSNPAIPATQTGDASPLDGFAKLWDKDAKDGSPLTLSTTIPIDNAKVMEAARTFDFTKAIDPQLLDKATKGDQGSMLEIIKVTAQNAFAQSSATTARIVQQALAQQAERFQNEYFPEIMRRTEAAQMLRKDNPILDNPAAKPMIRMLEEQFAVKYPTASPTEITNHATKFFSDFSTEFLKGAGKSVVDTKDVVQQQTKEAAKNYDWATAFGIPEGATF